MLFFFVFCLLLFICLASQIEVISLANVGILLAVLLAQHHLLSGWIDVDLTSSAEQALVMSTSLL